MIEWLKGKKLAFGIVFLAVLWLPGCTKPPAKTILADIDGKPVLAWDKDQDGQPDVNAEGEVEIISGGEIYGYMDTADSVLPTVLQAVAGVLGVPLLVGIGAAWRKHKFGRIIANTVMSVQAARARLKTEKLDNALDIVDETLGSVQTRETTNIIRDMKEKLGAKPGG